jgi:hypothetical protein
MEIRAKKFDILLRLFVPLGILIAIDYFWHGTGFFGISSWNFIIAIAIIGMIFMLFHYHLTYLIIRDDIVVVRSGILSPKYEIAISEISNITYEKQNALTSIWAQKSRKWYGWKRNIIKIDLYSGESIFINVTDMDLQDVKAFIDNILQ